MQGIESMLSLPKAVVQIRRLELRYSTYRNLRLLALKRGNQSIRVA